MKRLVLSAALILMFIVPAAFGCEGGASAPDGTGGAQVQDPQEEIGGVEEPDDTEPVPVRPDDYRDRADGVDYGKVERISYYSEVAGGTKHATVLMPPDAKEGERYPVLYLLHGLSDNCTGWSRYTAVERYARNYGVAVVMPEAIITYQMKDGSTIVVGADKDTVYKNGTYYAPKGNNGELFYNVVEGIFFS